MLKWLKRFNPIDDIDNSKNKDIIFIKKKYKFLKIFFLNLDIWNKKSMLIMKKPIVVGSFITIKKKILKKIKRKDISKYFFLFNIFKII